MPITPPDWHAADKAYQLHHINCPHAAPLALPQLPSAARGGCYVTCAVLTSAKEKPGTVAGLAAYSAVKSKLSS